MGPTIPTTITVQKLDHAGKLVTSYPGRIIQQNSASVVLGAPWQRDRLELPYVVLEPGDRFVEFYFTDRWYNIFEIHDRDDGHLKGWYCNITYPAILEACDRLSYIDLALDLWVSPLGEQTVLDEDEFAALDLDDQTRLRARAALAELQDQFRKNKKPDL